MKHKVCINIAKPDGSRTQVVKAGTIHIRKKVQTVEIHEMREGGKS